MTAVATKGPSNWTRDDDEEGHKDYTITWPVVTTNALDGPEVAWTASGLPLPGASLNIGNTVNAWAFYNRKGSARLKKVEANRKLWELTTVFTTRPANRCTTNAVGDPLLEPHRVRGSFNQVMEEALRDTSGAPVDNSAEQRYTGAIVQIPRSRPVVELEMNVSWINLAWMAEYADAVNSNVQWSQPVRTIKCTVGPWERVLYGTCYYYFIVRFTFELKYDKWDVVLLDEGTRVKVAGSSPVRYHQYKDELSENGRVLLDGAGNKLAAGGTPVWNTFRILREKDFSVVGWPSSLL